MSGLGKWQSPGGHREVKQSQQSQTFPNSCGNKRERLTVHDHSDFLHVGERDVVLGAALVLPSLVPGDAINVQILSVLKWFCYNNRKETAHLIVAATGFIQRKQQPEQRLLDIANPTTPKGVVGEATADHGALE